MNFWELKNKLRRYLQLKNKTILIIEHMAEESNKSISEIVEELIEDSPLYWQTVEKLKDEYPGIKSKF